MDTSKVLTAFDIILKLGVYIPSIVKAVETPGNGAAKTKAVANTVAQAVNALPSDVKENLHLPSILTAANSLTDAAVDLYNVAGEFKKSEPAIPALPPAPEPAQPAVDIEALKKHIANMERRLAEFQAGSAPDKQARIEKLTKNIAEARAELASLE